MSIRIAHWRSQFHRSLGGIVPILFFIITYWIMPLEEVLQFDPDEGIELAKVILFSQGYSLYDQIWNDQPPLLTVLLAGWLKVFGMHIGTARMLILGFSSILVGAFYNSLRFSVGVGSALLGTTALCLTLNFLRLSVSVMRGLPAIALAMLGIYLLLWATAPSPKNDVQQPQQQWFRLGAGAIASGICFGLSLQIKFFTVLLVPACFLHLLLGWHWRKPPKFTTQNRISILLWLASCGVTVLIIAILTQSFSLEQLLGTHVTGTTRGTLQREPSWILLLMFLAQDLDYSLLAGIGIWQLFKSNRRALPRLPLVWLMTVVGVLSFYQPLWDHYYPLISIPVVWLATDGVTQSYSVVQQKQWVKRIHWNNLKLVSGSGLATGFLILAIALTPLKLALLGFQNHLLVKDANDKTEIIQKVQDYRSQTHWLFTDLPIVSFYTGLKVPPELAVFSIKRIGSGSLSTSNLTSIMTKYQPEQVLLGRYRKIEEELQPFLNQHYIRHFTKNKITHYTHSKLMAKPSLKLDN